MQGSGTMWALLLAVLVLKTADAAHSRGAREIDLIDGEINAPSGRANILLQAVAGTAAGSCSDLSDVSSKTAMMSAGWSFDIDFDNVWLDDQCGGGANFYGWSNDVGTLTSPALVGSGNATVEFGNCWDAGNVKLLLNDELIDSAAPNVPKGPGTRTKSFTFEAGDVVKLRGNAVINLKSFSINCAEGAVTLSSKGSNNCNLGSVVSQDECLAQAQSAIPDGASMGRTSLVAGSWAHVPAGCSVQSGGDWAAHFNTNAQGSNDGKYSLLCSGAAFTSAPTGPPFCTADGSTTETALGVASGVATLTSNSEADGHTAAMGALDYTGTGVLSGWKPDFATKDPYIQIDFSHILKITDVKLQGGKNGSPRGACGAPTKIAVSYSADVAGNFVMLEEQPGFSDLFTQNDAFTPPHGLCGTKHVSLQWPIAARTVRIHLKAYILDPIMRVELYGPGCQYEHAVSPVGIMNNRYPVSSFSRHPEKQSGKMDPSILSDAHLVIGVITSSPWPTQWWQMDLGSILRIVGIAYRPRTDFDVNIIDQFTVRYSTEDSPVTWTPYTASGTTEAVMDMPHQFGGAVTYLEFFPRFDARHLRLLPKACDTGTRSTGYGFCSGTVEYFMEVPAFQWSLAQSSLEAVPIDDASGKVNCTEAFEATAPAWTAWSAGLNADNAIWTSSWQAVQSMGRLWQAMRKKVVRGCGSLTKEALCYKAGQDADGTDCCVRKESTPVCSVWDASKEETSMW